MASRETTAKVAVVQAAPVIMEQEATIAKARSLTLQASEQGARIVVFPEAFVPGYPRGLTFGTVIGSRSDDGRRDFERYARNAVAVPSKASTALAQIAKDTGVYLVMGVAESDSEHCPSSLYCTTLYYGPDGSLLGKHRKLKPTGAERLVWAEGDGSTLTAVDTAYGVLGGLICWENYMPLARMAMYEQRVGIYVAPTADARETWQATIRHIALEGRCYVLSANQYVTKCMYPTDLLCYAELRGQPDVMSRGGSAVVDPLGNYVAGPVYDRECIIMEQLDLGRITQSRYDFDAVGHYSRPDVFSFRVKR